MNKAHMRHVNWNGDNTVTLLVGVNDADPESVAMIGKQIEVRLAFSDIEIINRVVGEANRVLAERARKGEKS